MGTFGIRRAVIAICALLLFSGVFTRCVAQTTYGSILGTVRDSSGAVIVGAKITVTNVGTAVKTTQATNAVGAYSFNTLFPGAYTVHAEMQGFKSVDVQNLQLQIDQTLRTDITMPLGQVNQQVTVTETLATLNTDTADVGEVIENRQVVDLPLNGRQFVQLATLANDVYLNAPNNAGDSAGDQIISEGSRLFSNSYLLDGVDIKIQRGGSYGLSPSIDAIGEFKLLQNTYSAEYGFGQTVLTATIKSGTNQFHGVAFDFMRNDKLDAVQAFNGSGKKNKLRQNQFGASFGGPIIKEKLFFFLNYEGSRRTEGNVNNLLNPTAAQLAGHLGAASPAIDPLTGKQFVYNGVPGDIDPARISQFAKAAVSLGAYATPSGPAVGGVNLSALANTTAHNDQGLARFDYQMSGKDHVDGFVSFNNYGDATPGVNLYTGPADWRKGYPIVGAEWAHTFSPTLLNSFRFGYSHQQPYEGQSATASSNLAATAFGVLSVDPDSFALAIPQINITGFAATGAGEWQPSGVMDTNSQLSDLVMITRGHHILSLGGEFHNVGNTDLGWATQNGRFDFNGSYTGTNGGANGDPLADFLLGTPSYAHAALKGSGDYPIALQWITTGFYAQDDWRITPELTLNLGLRWEMVQNAKEVDNQFDNWDIVNQKMLYAGKTMSDRILPSPKADVLPRLGAAWSPKALPKTVIRGGFSIASGGTRGWEFDLQHFQPPYVNEDFLNIAFDPTAQNLPTYILPGVIVPVPLGKTAPVPLFPTPLSTCCDITNGSLLNAALYDLVEKKTPKYAEWNFNIQHELPGAFVLQLGYVGTHGYHLPIRYDANLATTPNTAGNITPAQSRVAYPGEGYVCGNTFEGFSNFDALNVHLERRFAGGKALTVAYSWAKDLEVANQDEAELFDIKNQRLNYGPQQMAHHLVLNYIYELPFGRGKQWANNSNKAVDAIIGGWQFDGITSWHTGYFLTASSGVDNGMGGRAGNYADAVAGQNPNSGPKKIGEWFNLAAFAAPPFPRYGTTHAGTIVGPGYTDFDLAFFKNIHYNETKYLQFRWEMFNAFNHNNLGNPDTNVSDFNPDPTLNSFGVIKGENGKSRIMQASMKVYF